MLFGAPLAFGPLCGFNKSMKQRVVLLAVSIIALALTMAARPSIARADDTYTFVVKKQEEKARTRWSLSEWIDTRDRMRMMDLWLALHSPSPYEFIFGGAWTQNDLSAGSYSTTYSGSEFMAAAYASIFGLGVEREGGVSTRYSALMHLRIFGYHYQSTHIRLEGGLRNTSSEATSLNFRNPVAGVGMVVYLGKFFGIEGLYRHFFDGTPNGSGLGFSGNRYEGGAFIDFSFLRVYGKYVQEKLSSEPSLASSNSTASDATRSGPQAGLKVFF
jgi:hypothetical protein